MCLNEVQDVQVPSFKELSKFPEMRRDIALIASKETPVADVLSTIRANAGEYLTKLNIFDVYVGKGVDLDKKSLALGLTWQHPSRSEEHTSELQSRPHLVCRLLLEKKNCDS